MLFPLPSALEIMPLSSGLATEALTDFQTALFQQVSLFVVLQSRLHLAVGRGG